MEISKSFEQSVSESIAAACELKAQDVVVLSSRPESLDFTVRSVGAWDHLLREELSRRRAPFLEVVDFSAVVPSTQSLWLEGTEEIEGDVRTRPEFWGVRVRELAEFHDEISEDLAAYCSDHQLCFGPAGCLHLCKSSKCTWGDHSGVAHRMIDKADQSTPMLPNMHAVAWAKSRMPEPVRWSHAT